MSTQAIEYIDATVVLPPPVKKLIWNGTEFVPFLLYRKKGLPNNQQLVWLWQTYGKPRLYEYGRHWDYSGGGNYTIMDDKVYMFYTMKWGTK